MKPLIRCMAGMVCAGLLLPGSASYAETFDRGQALYENHCRTCHEEGIHVRDNRRVTSIGELRHRVASWSYHAALGWSDEDIADVVDYLDRRFYHYTDRP